MFAKTIWFLMTEHQTFPYFPLSLLNLLSFSDHFWVAHSMIFFLVKLSLTTDVLPVLGDQTIPIFDSTDILLQYSSGLTLNIHLIIVGLFLLILIVFFSLIGHNTTTHYQCNLLLNKMCNIKSICINHVFLERHACR